jgi:hypothetical protein
MIDLNPQLMRFLLLLCMIGILLIAVLFLRQRSLQFWLYLGWGLLAVCIPFIGPFLVLIERPGSPRP